MERIKAEDKSNFMEGFQGYFLKESFMNYIA